MCSIVGFKGNYNSLLLYQMLKITKHRGEDATGIYLKNTNKTIIDKNINLNEEKYVGEYTQALGHNLLSIYKKENNELNLEPYTIENLKLVFNGEIYNCEEIKKNLKIKKDLSDGEILINLINHELKSKNIKDAIKKTLNTIDGDYAFALSDGEEILLARDPIGVKPLYYTNIENNLIFASEEKALKKDFKNIENLKPGNYLYKGKTYEAINLFEDLEKYTLNYETLTDKLIEILYKSVYNRVKNLNEVGLLLSGGVDSGFLAYILKDISQKTNLNLKLYAVGNQNSKDIEYSKKIAEDIHLPIEIQKVDYELVKYYINDTINAIESTNLMKLGVGMTIFLATKLMKKDKLKVGITGQGADELFAGYNRYIKHIEEEKRENLENELIHDIKNMHHVNLERDDKASMKNTIELRIPYLSKDMIKFALKVPTEYKIKTKEDKLKKHILRDAAIKYGVPEEIAKRRKKAAQYGSGIDKILKKKIRKEINIDELLKY